MAAPVSVAEFKTKFDRAFPFGSGLDAVRDSDINSAFDDALLVYNPALWSTADGKVAFLYLSAHYVAVMIQATGGLKSSVGAEGVDNRSNGITASKTVGSVSVSYEALAEQIKKIPALMPFWETEYGKRYVQMLLPKLVGNVGLVGGWSNVDGDVYIPVPDAGP